MDSDTIREIRETVDWLEAGPWFGLAVRDMNKIDRAEIARQMAEQLTSATADEVLDEIEYYLPKRYAAGTRPPRGRVERMLIDPFLNRRLCGWRYRSEAGLERLLWETRFRIARAQAPERLLAGSGAYRTSK